MILRKYNKYGTIKNLKTAIFVDFWEEQYNDNCVIDAKKLILSDSIIMLSGFSDFIKMKKRSIIKLQKVNHESQRRNRRVH